MPLEIRIHRGSAFADHRGAPIERAALEQALHVAAAPFARSTAGDDAWWVRYPEWLSAKSAGELWFSATWKAPGVASLAVSYANCRIARNAIDVLHHALRVAEQLRARVFTESGEVTDENVHTFHEPPGRAAWIQAAVSSWLATIARIDDEPLGALEIPVDGRDLVPEFALFQVTPERRVDIDDLGRALTSRAQLEVKMAPPGLYVMSGDRFAAQVFARPDGQWQVRLGHARTSWPAASRAALACVRTIRDLSGGNATLVGTPFDAVLEREFEAHTTASGVEFYAWFGTKQNPAEFIERNIELAASLMERATGASCEFDHAAVIWLEGHLKQLREADAAERARHVLTFGCFLGQCIATIFDGTWTKLKGSASGLAVEVRPKVFVNPWDKIEGFLNGDDGDSVVGFVRTIEHDHLKGDQSKPVFIS